MFAIYKEIKSIRELWALVSALIGVLDTARIVDKKQIIEVQRDLLRNLK